MIAYPNERLPLWSLASKPAEPSQIPDFGPAPSMSTLQTSRKARRAIRKELPDKRAQVLSLIRASADGLTDNEGIELSGMTNGWRARRGELEKDGLVQNSGRTRPSPKHHAVVWIATESPTPGAPQ